MSTRRNARWIKFWEVEEMKCAAGHFEDTVTTIPPTGTITLSIPTGIAALVGGSLMQISRGMTVPTRTWVSGAEIFFTTDPDDSVCFVKETESEHLEDESPLKGSVVSAAPIGGAHTSYKKDGWLTPDIPAIPAWEHHAFGKSIHAIKAWVDGANIKIELHNIDIDSNTVDVFLTYVVCGN